MTILLVLTIKVIIPVTKRKMAPTEGLLGSLPLFLVMCIVLVFCLFVTTLLYRFYLFTLCLYYFITIDAFSSLRKFKIIIIIIIIIITIIVIIIIIIIIAYLMRTQKRSIADL